MVIKQFSHNSCTVCGDSISDPVCRRCYIKQTEVSLNDLNLNEITNEIILKKIKNKSPIETINDTECILCREENVAMCRYCFSIILINILRDLNFPEEMIENLGYNIMYEETSLEREYF